MKVFISGIAGFLGSHLARAWLDRGASVVGCDNLVGGYRDNVPPGALFDEFDCNELGRLRAAMQGSELVYHCAALAYESLSLFSPHEISKSLTGATTAMLSAACANRVKRFVYMSSAARYGHAPKGVYLSETSPAIPADPYGIEKLAGEQLVETLCETHGIEWMTAIPHNIYGPAQKYDDPFRSAVAVFTNMMLSEKQPIIYGNGEQTRCFSYVDDCIAPLVRLGTKRIEFGFPGEKYNIGPDDAPISVNTLARLIADILKFDLKPVHVAARPGEVREITPSAARARRHLDYQTNTSLKAGLITTVDWIKRRGPRLFKYHLPIEIMNEKTPDTWVKRLL